MKQLARITGFAALAAFVLVGCGDDGGTSSAPSNADQIVASFEDLAVCTAKREGAFAYVRDEKTEYVCTGGDWIPASDVLSSQGDGSAASGGNPKEAWLNPNIPYGTMMDDRDDQTYKTVVIGSRTWMAENLNYEYKVNGVTYGNWCYNDSAEYCARYGRLYTWAAAMDSAMTGCGKDKYCATSDKTRGVCPNGWHLPSQEEWQILLTVVGGQSTAGSALKTSSGWDNYGNGTDASGFSALPSGYRGYDGNFNNVGYQVVFWSSSEDAQNSAYNVGLYYINAYADLDSINKIYGSAVRCVKD